MKVSVRKFKKNRPYFVNRIGTIVEIGNTHDSLLIETKDGEQIQSKKKFVRGTIYSVIQYAKDMGYDPEEIWSA